MKTNGSRIPSGPTVGAVSRRSVIAGGAALTLAGAAAACSKKAPAPEEGVNTSVVAQCEKMLDLALTDDERAQIVATIDDQLEAIRAIRAIDFENGEAPALVFNPLLPGQAVPEQSGGVRNAVAAGDLPAGEDDIAFAPASRQAHWIRTRQISSRELTELYLRRIARYQPLLLNFITVTADLAREQAARADEEIAAGHYRGPLHGLPYGLKDLVATAGIPTTWGATPYKDRVPDRDALIVTRLREAGAVLIGKTTAGAIAYGDIWFGGKTRSPWNPHEGSSGSSAGSASATAAGLCSFSIGTETLGSIVSPSARCGTTGLRPTFGRVPRTGAMALCWSLDKIGPICRSVADTALVLDAINGGDVSDASAHDIGFAWDAAAAVDGMRIGYSPAWFENAAGPDRQALEALRSLPVALVEIDLPDWPYNDLFTVVEAEAAAAFQELTLSNRDDEMVWQEDRAWPNTWRRAHFFSAVDYVQIDRLRRRVMKMMAERMAGLDAVFSPNFAGNLLVITNFTGHPCLTQRAGFVDSPTRGLGGASTEQDSAAPAPTFRVPENVTLWGPLFEERRLLTLGRALEAATGAADERPPLERWMEEFGGRAP
ncbi:MAG: amidase [Rhodothalassiaceae bacterium]